MATEVTCIVDTDGTQSPDYTSLSAAIAGETGASPVAVTSADLVTNDEQLTIECRASGAHAADTGSGTLTGFTTDPTRYVKVCTHADHRHAGAWSTSKYRITQPDRHGIGITITQDYTRIEGLQIELTSSASAGSERGIVVNNTGCRIHGNIVRRTGTASGDGFALAGLPTGSSIYIWNNLIYGVFEYSLNDNQRYTTVTLSGAIYNNTMPGLGDYLRFNTGNASGLAYINNIHGSVTMYNVGTVTTNADDDDVTFADSGNGDYSLASNDTGALDEGTDLSANGILAFSDDILGVSRTTWDIGAFEYVSGAAEATYSGRGIGRGISRGIMR